MKRSTIARRVAQVAVDAPEGGAVAPARRPQLAHGVQERRVARRADAVADLHRHRAGLGKRARSSMNRSSQGVPGVTSCSVAHAQREGPRQQQAGGHDHGRHAQRERAGPTTPDTAPQNAEPMANEPSALSVCSATARERTHGGALVWVAVLKVDITAIQAAPPMTSAQ